jgi:hypothetical protein
MGGLFGKPKVVSAPPVPPPAPIPEIDMEAPRRTKRTRGRRETIITGELEPVTTKKTLLG